MAYSMPNLSKLTGGFVASLWVSKPFHASFQKRWCEISSKVGDVMGDVVIGGRICDVMAKNMFVFV